MDKHLIKLLYGIHGWTEKQVSDFLKIPITAVRQYIEDMRIKKGKHQTYDLLPDGSSELMRTNETGNDISYNENVRTLKSQAAQQELELAPIVAAIEMTLYHKVMEAAQAVDSTNVKQLAEVVSTYKKMQSDNIVSTAIKSDSASEKPGTVYAIAKMVFND